MRQEEFERMAGQRRESIVLGNDKHVGDGVLAFAEEKNQSDVAMKVADIDVRDENGDKIVVSCAKDDKKDNDGKPLLAKAAVKG